MPAVGGWPAGRPRQARRGAGRVAKGQRRASLGDPEEETPWTRRGGRVQRQEALKGRDAAALLLLLLLILFVYLLGLIFSLATLQGLPGGDLTGGVCESRGSGGCVWRVL